MFNFIRKINKSTKDNSGKQKLDTNIDLISYNEFIISNMNTEPMKYIDLGFNNFINKIDKLNLNELLSSKKTCYICVSDWYNNTSNFFENKTYNLYINSCLNEKITNYLIQNGFATTSNVYYQHEYLGGKSAEDDIIIFGNPEIYYEQNIQRFVDKQFDGNSEFWSTGCGMSVNDIHLINHNKGFTGF